MVNMSVPYVRPAQSLTTLQSELNAVWPGRQPDLGFVTGYKSADNLSGHNPNNLGVVMGYDIGTYPHGAINEVDGRALADYLRTECNQKLQYLIHDMSPGAPRPMIAGNHTGWKWVDYTGADPHSNHIHLSVVDLYWGDPVDVPAAVYDSTSSWGIAARFGKGGARPQGGSIKPIKKEGFLMALTDKQQQEIYDRITRYADTKISDVADKVMLRPITRAGGREGTTTLQSTVAYLDANLDQLRAMQDPKAIAAAIPDALAQQVVDALSARLAQ